MLVGGLAFGLGSLFYSISAGYFWGYPTPYYLMTNDKPIQWADESTPFVNPYTKIGAAPDEDE